MAENKKQEQKKEKKPDAGKEEKKKAFLISKEAPTGRIVRILQTDIPGDKNVYAGLTRIKGVSWSISNALCIILKMDKMKKIETLTKEEITKIEETLKQHKFPQFLLNRRKDFTTGENKHILGQALDIEEELDIKRLKKIRSFRGLRHALGQPTRGQSTKSHFRTNRKKGVGMKLKKPTTQVGGKK
jgi:small subunit ribosomal protein S13